ncbi:MAG: MbtH family NRPS accessory protein [Candidatus Baltobacteraceae bacterium]|jgi:MbtH protein
MDQNTEEWDYTVLVNEEEQYSLWPEFKDVPAGWTRVGPVADKAACLAWIEQHWTDLRPKSIRRG